MNSESRVDSGDRALIQIVDAALAEAARKSGPWLVCRPGCFECCMGPFPITQLDARRLRRGLAGLQTADPARAARVRERARQAVARISAYFPGDPSTGLLEESEDVEFSDEMDDDPCPALDPWTGTCDLYAARPVTCRAFGPPVRCGSDAVGVCELCFVGARDEEIAACEVELDPEGVESRLLEELESATGSCGRTLVAFSLA